MAYADPLVVLVAELVEIGCPTDGLRHLLDDQGHAEVLLACAEGLLREPRFEALCGHRFVPDSLLAAPRPICPACARVAGPRLSAARRQVVGRRVPAPRRTGGLARTTWERMVAANATVPLTRDRAEPA